MTEFFQGQTFTTDENGVIDDIQTTPIIEMKKLNGQGSIYKLTDANCESINAEYRRRDPINLDKFVRSVRSQFGTGDYTLAALHHSKFPDELQQTNTLDWDNMLIRTGLYSALTITETDYSVSKIEDYETWICTATGETLLLDTWHKLTTTVAKEDDDIPEEMRQDYVDLFDSVKESIIEQTKKEFTDASITQFIDRCDKINVERKRIYE